MGRGLPARDPIFELRHRVEIGVLRVEGLEHREREPCLRLRTVGFDRPAQQGLGALEIAALARDRGTEVEHRGVALRVLRQGVEQRDRFVGAPDLRERPAMTHDRGKGYRRREREASRSIDGHVDLADLHRQLGDACPTLSDRLALAQLLLEERRRITTMPTLQRLDGGQDSRLGLHLYSSFEP